MKDRYFHHEEDFHARDRKQFKKERRHAQETDRSKFKKSDLDQVKKEKAVLIGRSQLTLRPRSGHYRERASGSRWNMFSCSARSKD